MAAYDSVWWGVRNGGLAAQLSDRPSPAAEATIVTDRAAASSSGGSSPGIVRASSVLPDPGRPGQQQSVPAGERDLERAARLRLAAHLGEVRDVRRRAGRGRRGSARPPRVR